MELKELCGERMLSGVDFERVSNVAQTCRFRLDGKTYTAIEDDEDGYRSCMGDLTVGDEPLTNTWSPVCVLGSMSRTPGDDVLELRDITTSRVVLRVGTENTDDYYPEFVAEFTPEALAHNIEAAGKETT